MSTKQANQDTSGSQPDPESHQKRISIDCAGRTDVGKLRSTNQDHFLIADLHKNMHVLSSSVSFQSPELFGSAMGKLLLVADGIGGSNAGEVASAMATQATAQFLLNSMHWLFHPQEPEIEQFIKDLKLAAEFSHRVVRTDADHDPNHQGMGSTLTLAFIQWPMLYVLHVGDSRCYLMHEGKLQLLTKDQTIAQYLADRGHLKDQEVEKSPFKNVLASAIGIVDGKPDAVVYRKQLSPGDRVLICSDGVNAHLEDSEIGAHLTETDCSSEICDRIIARANERGGKDNITVVTAIFN